MKVEAAYFYETLLPFYHTAQNHIQKGNNYHSRGISPVMTWRD